MLAISDDDKKEDDHVADPDIVPLTWNQEIPGPSFMGAVMLGWICINAPFTIYFLYF